jgi:hypothetical protein
MKTTGRIWKSFSALVLLSASLLLAQELPTPPSDSPEGPTEDMMAPVKTLARYMATVDGAVLPTVFAEDGLVIVENFPPYIFSGKDAAVQWDAGYRKHVGRLKDLKCDFGTAHDFNRTGDRVYFVLPTTWRGLQPEGLFEEHGGWSFVLEKSSGQWRIIAYGWGATDETDWPTKKP